jgi:hypothetical protein
MRTKKEYSISYQVSQETRKKRLRKSAGLFHRGKVKRQSMRHAKLVLTESWSILLGTDIPRRRTLPVSSGSGIKLWALGDNGSSRGLEMYMKRSTSDLHLRFMPFERPKSSSAAILGLTCVRSPRSTWLRMDPSKWLTCHSPSSPTAKLLSGPNL